MLYATYIQANRYYSNLKGKQFKQHYTSYN